MTRCRRTRLWRTGRVLSWVGVWLGLIPALPAQAWQDTLCPAAASPAVESGWGVYRMGDAAVARDHFAAARDRCPDHWGAVTGLGYAELRLGNLRVARELFERVIARAPHIVDARVGRAILAWRDGDHERARMLLEGVLQQDSSNQEARDLLAQLPAAESTPPVRPPLVLPDSVVYPARAMSGRFEIRTPEGWRPFYVKGVNLGAALPGRYPSEFPDSATYTRWLEQIGTMGANTIRLYTIHPPHFYRALRSYNLEHPEYPLWLIHGVWTELPPGDDYTDPAWEAEFFAEMHRVVDLLHGRADLPARAGHASGHYTADVSPWTLGYIIGREWEPYSVAGYNRLHPDRRGWDGQYLRVSGGTPMDAWLGKATEEIIAYEMGAYRAQRPVAYTNWPTLDPLHHPTEATAAEQAAIRARYGETVGALGLEFDDDGVSLDAMLVRATDAYPAGYFTAYHAYPYYPDFMVFDPGYGAARSPWGPSNYWGYLRELQAHHAGIPLLIAEYGLPASFGNAHVQPQGWHHGGLAEDAQAAGNVRLTQEIAASGAAGGILFAWIDEWFKANWLTLPFELPRDRDRLWLNRLDAEEHYGMLAVEPGSALAASDIAPRRAAWRAAEPLYSSPDGVTVRAAADEAYLHLRIETGANELPSDLLVGFDMVLPHAGEFRWPDGVGERLPIGIEFALRIRDGEARLLAHPPYNAFQIDALPRLAAPMRSVPQFESAPPALFSARVDRRYGRPFRPLAEEDGRYDSLRVVISRRRFDRAGGEYPAIGYDRGVLPRGPVPDGFWEFDEMEGALEVRVPWGLLNVTDPSSRTVLLDDLETAPREEFGTTAVDAIGIVAALRDANGDWSQWPASGEMADVARFTWEPWAEPSYRVRLRPTYEAMREVWRTLGPAVEAGGSGQ